jgi:hypothetical protein
MIPLQWHGRAKIREIGGSGLDSFGSRHEKVAGSCEIGNELLGPIKCREFLDKLRN